jgi:hypothetical protein
MAKYAEGNRVIDASTDTAISSALSNDAEDQLKAMLGPLYVAKTAAHYDNSGSNHWYYKGANDPPYWDRSGSHANPLHIPLGTLRTGQKITAIKVVVFGDSQTGGTIKLEANVLDATPDTKTELGSAGSDPWNFTGWAIKTITLSPTSHTVLDFESLFVEFITPTTGTARVLGVYYQIQFGN